MEVFERVLGQDLNPVCLSINPKPVDCSVCVPRIPKGAFSVKTDSGRQAITWKTSDRFGGGLFPLSASRLWNTLLRETCFALFLHRDVKLYLFKIQKALVRLLLVLLCCCFCVLDFFLVFTRFLRCSVLWTAQSLIERAGYNYMNEENTQLQRKLGAC